MCVPYFLFAIGTKGFGSPSPSSHSDCVDAADLMLRQDIIQDPTWTEWMDTNK